MTPNNALERTVRHRGPSLAAAQPAYVIVLRSYPRDAVPERERRLAPTLAVLAFGVYGLMLVGFWVIYAINAS